MNPVDRLIGHEWAERLLQSAIDSRKVSHSYIFSGPNGIGKSHLAHLFVMALCCERPASSPAAMLPDGLRFCGECRTCRMIREDKHPDVTVVGLEWQARQANPTGKAEAGSNAVLKIDTVRTVQQDISRAPREAPWRVFIVEDAATMQAAAANAFLKTLEEPPSRAIIILIADSDRVLMPTIISRCQVFQLRSVPKVTIEQALKERNAGQEQAHLLASIAAGRPAFALQAYYDKTHQDLDDRDEALMHHDEMLSADRAGRLSFAEELNTRWIAQGERRASVLVMLNTWLGWWRDLALVYSGQEQYASNPDKLVDLRQQAASVTMRQIKDMLQGLTRATAELDSNVNPRLALGDLFINKLPRIQSHKV